MCRLQLAPLFKDHMVLQEEKEVTVWGKALDGEVTITFADQIVVAKVNNQRFMATLAPVTAGGPFELIVTCKEETIYVRDILVGEVFLAAGQSNMELKLEESEGSKEALANREYPMIRIYNVIQAPVVDEELIKKEQDNPWMMQSDAQFGQVSAVAYHFAVQMAKKLNKPIGIIDCYKGGTNSSCWLSKDCMNSFEEGRRRVNEYDQLVGDKTEEQFDQEQKEFEETFAAWCKLVDQLRQDNPKITDKELEKKAGPCPWNPPAGPKSVFRPAGLYESMFLRIVPFTVRAVLYYQGESDEDWFMDYEAMLTHLVKLWREQLRQGEIPFILVQLPMFIEKGKEESRRWPVIRKAQEQVYRNLPNMGMATALDCGEFNNLHPKEKRIVAKRLTDEVFEVVFNKNIKGTSVFAKEAIQRGHQVIVSFECDQKIYSKEEDGVVYLLEIAGENQKFQVASGQVIDHKLIVECKEVSSPKYVRYAFVDYGKVSLYAGEVPVAPFDLEVKER